MSDEDVVVEDDTTPEEAVIEGGTDQGPYTGQSMDIPEVPYNPAAGMTASEVTQRLAENQQGGSDDDDLLRDDDDDDLLRDDEE